MPIIIIDEFDLRFIESVALLKGKYLIAYADAFAINLALTKAASLVTGDPEILKIAKHEKRLKVASLN